MKARIRKNEPVIIEPLLAKAREATVWEQRAHEELYRALEVLQIADDEKLCDAISRYLREGEYGLTGICAEVAAACRRRDTPAAEEDGGDCKMLPSDRSPAEKARAKLIREEFERLNREIAKWQIDYEKLADLRLDANMGLDAQDLKELVSSFGGDAPDVNWAGVQKKRERCAGDADIEAYIDEKVRERDEFEKEMRRQEKAAGRRACIPPRGMAGMKYD